MRVEASNLVLGVQSTATYQSVSTLINVDW